MYIVSAMDGYSTNVSPAHRGDMVQLLPRPPAQTFACSDNLSVKPLPRTPANLKTYVYYTLSNTERTCLSRVGLGLFLSSRVPGFFFGFRLSIESKKIFACGFWFGSQNFCSCLPALFFKVKFTSSRVLKKLLQSPK